MAATVNSAYALSEGVTFNYCIDKEAKSTLCLSASNSFL